MKYVSVGYRACCVSLCEMRIALTLLFVLHVTYSVYNEKGYKLKIEMLEIQNGKAILYKEVSVMQ